MLWKNGWSSGSHHTKPLLYQMDVLPKTFVQIILAAKWLVRHSSSVRLPTNSDDLCLLFCLYPSCIDESHPTSCLLLQLSIVLYSWRKVIINLFTLLGISLWSENSVILSGLVPARVRTHLSPLEVLHCQKIPLFFLDWCRRIPYTFVTTWSVPLSENSVILSGLVPAGVCTHLPPLEVSVVRKFLDPFWAGASRRTNLPPIEVFSYQKIPLSFLARGWYEYEYICHLLPCQKCRYLFERVPAEVST